MINFMGVCVMGRISIQLSFVAFLSLGTSLTSVCHATQDRDDPSGVAAPASGVVRVPPDIEVVFSRPRVISDAIFPRLPVDSHITFRLDRSRLQRRIDHLERLQEVRDLAQELPMLPVTVFSRSTRIRPPSSRIPSLIEQLPNDLLSHAFSLLNPVDIARLTPTCTRIYEGLTQTEGEMSFGINPSEILCRAFKRPVRDLSRSEYVSIMLAHKMLLQPTNTRDNSAILNELEGIFRNDEVRFALPLFHLLKIMRRDNTAGDFNRLVIAGSRGNERAQDYVNQNIFYDGSRPEADRLRDLQKNADLGDRNAQSWINQAMYKGELGLGARSEANRLRYLQERADLGDRNAQNWINQATYEGTLGEGVRPEVDRFRDLRDRENQGDANAQNFVNRAVYEGVLGLGAQSEAERFHDLQARANQGEDSAQHFVNRAVYEGRFGQGTRPEAARFRDLQARANQGDDSARNWVARAMWDGTLGQGVQSLAKRFLNLHIQASLGNKWARAMAHLSIPDPGSHDNIGFPRSTYGLISFGYDLLHALLNGTTLND